MPTRVDDSKPAALLRRISAIDGTVARAAAAGEERAFDRVYNALFPLVWRLSVQRANGSKRDAEELTARLLEEIVLCLERGEPEVALKSRVAEELRASERVSKRGGARAVRSVRQPRR